MWLIFVQQLTSHILKVYLFSSITINSRHFSRKIDLKFKRIRQRFDHSSDELCYVKPGTVVGFNLIDPHELIGIYIAEPDVSK